MTETMKPLNLNDDWEDVVNAHRNTLKAEQTKQHRKRILSRVWSLALSALACAAGSILFFLILPNFYPLSVAFACAASLQIGRFLESWDK